MKPLVVSAPFGNCISSEHATSTLGTYTFHNRAGFLRWYMFWRILYTLRYRPSVGGWTNKLGLPSPGIAHLEGLPRQLLTDKIVSINGFNPEEWRDLIRTLHALGTTKSFPIAGLPFAATSPMSFWVECNLSCPNVGHLSVPPDLFQNAIERFGADKTIFKLSPVNYWAMFEMAYAAGARLFHATNTLPVPAGGLSGKALKRISLDVVKRIKDAKPDVTIIGGGGITTPEDVIDYRHAGASHVAVASALLKPTRGWFKGPRERFLKEIAQAATAEMHA